MRREHVLDGGALRAIPGDGVLQATTTYSEGAGTTSSYRWRLVPDR